MYASILKGAALHGAALLLLAQVPEAQLREKSERARLWMAQQRFADAAVLYEELAKAVPGNAGLLMNLGMARHMAGQDAQAIAPLEASVKLQPLPPALLFLGASYLRTGQPAKAIAPLERFVAADPNHKEARQMLADAAAQSGNPGKAATHMAKLAEWDPGNAAVWYALGRAWQSLAIRTFEKIPLESGYWFALAADSRSRQNQSRAAFLLYRKAAEKLSRHRGLHAAIAGIYRRTGHADWAEAEDKAEAALGKPVCAKGPAATLECRFLGGQFQLLALSNAATPEALYWRTRAGDALSRAAFEKLAALGPSVELFRLQAEVATEQNRSAEAAAAWRSAVALAPADASLRLELASSLLRTREYEEAQSIVAAMLASEPDSPELAFLQGDILLNQQQPEKAIPYLQKSAAAQPAFLPARAALGRALILAGRGAEAIPHLQAALPLDEDASLHFQLARAYQAAGKADMAKQTLAKYQQLQEQRKRENEEATEAVQITAPPAR